MSSNHLMKACLAAVLALGLAACSSSDSGTDTSMPTEPTDPEPTPVSVSLSAVTAGHIPLVPTTHTITAGETADNGDVTFSCAADGDDCAVMVASDGTVTATGGTVTAMDSAAYAQRLADADQAATDKMRADAIIRLHGETSGARSDAEAAGKKASQALMDAEKYDGMLGVLATNGDSGVATDNAQKVLDAKTDCSGGRDGGQCSEDAGADRQDRSVGVV